PGAISRCPLPLVVSRPLPHVPTLFPYTTLFRSRSSTAAEGRCVRTICGPSLAACSPVCAPICPPGAAPCAVAGGCWPASPTAQGDRKSTRLNSSHVSISYAVLCLKQKRDVGEAE